MAHAPQSFSLPGCDFLLSLDFIVTPVLRNFLAQHDLELLKLLEISLPR